MSAQSEAGQLSLGSPLRRVFDAQGLPVAAYADPSITVDPEQHYGSITEAYTADVRAKLHAVLHHSSIAIHFSKVTEGRPYSIAIRLREMGFKGELHAVGTVNREIMHHLIRVGFTHFHLSGQSHVIPKKIVSPFSFFYQTVGLPETGEV